VLGRELFSLSAQPILLDRIQTQTVLPFSLAVAAFTTVFLGRGLLDQETTGFNFVRSVGAFCQFAAGHSPYHEFRYDSWRWMSSCIWLSLNTGSSNEIWRHTWLWGHQLFEKRSA